ncbi:MAG TPA: M14 family metallocarboxypeptidase [Verrucomicrobiae bacterium]|nr:M14 family metallocarboxypeptidase [Verrucomicrobiae bacterium]
MGEGLDLERVLRDIEIAAQTHGWQIEKFHASGNHPLLALTRRVANPKKRLYISTGIHGDEPAGPLAVLQLLQENRWPADVDIWLCPCLNPAGFTRNARENANGVDLNRQYLNPTAEETRAHINWLERQPSFDLCVCLHEDWESQGFYLYELNPDHQPSLAQRIIDRVAEICPIDLSEMIEGRDAVRGIISPIITPQTRPDWPEALYLLMYKTRLSYTVEAPSDYELKTRVAAEVAALRVVLESLEK